MNLGVNFFVQWQYIIQSHQYLEINDNLLKKTRGPFHESPGNFSGPKADLKLKLVE